MHKTSILTTLLLAQALCLISCQNANNQAPVEQEAPATTEKIVSIDTSKYNTDYITGHFDPSQHPDFATIAPEHASREGMLLHREAYAAFKEMFRAAQREGIRLVILSATRNFDYQRGIWEKKWNGQRRVDGMDLSQEMPDPRKRALKILNYSSMPGASRHHWGTDIDLNDFNNPYFESGEGLKVYEWLRKNAGKYGFCQPYTAKGPERPHGYNEEKWHWSYLPIARPLTKLAAIRLKDEMIKGFDGAAEAPQIGVVERYILGVNPECLD